MTRDLLIAAGYGPWLTYDGFNAAASLADAVASTIGMPIRRAQFIADSAAELVEFGPAPFEGREAELASLEEQAARERQTPFGSTEIWGSLPIKLAD